MVKKILFGRISSVLFILLTILLGSCAFEGEVFIAIVWDPSGGQPGGLTYNIDNVPAAGTLENGHYYRTVAGKQFDIAYGAFPTFFFTLSAKETFIGVEAAYYDLIIDSASPPRLIEVPPGY